MYLKKLHRYIELRVIYSVTSESKDNGIDYVGPLITETMIMTMLDL